MNRRNFIRALLALPVAAIAAPVAAPLIVEKVQALAATVQIGTVDISKHVRKVSYSFQMSDDMLEDFNWHAPNLWAPRDAANLHWESNGDFSTATVEYTLRYDLEG